MSRHETFDSDSEDDEVTGLLGPSSDQDQLDNSDDDVQEKLLADSDSDDAPEDIGFTESRRTVLDKVKETLKQIQSDKQLVKDRRKKKDELYKQQKQQRLSSLASSRLPEEFLDELPSEPVVKKKKFPEQSPDVTNVHDLFDNEDDSADGDEEPTDFIPLEGGQGNLNAVALSEFLKQPKSSEEKAASFRDSLLYSKKVPRQSAQALKGIQAKRKSRLK